MILLIAVAAGCSGASGKNAVKVPAPLAGPGVSGVKTKAHLSGTLLQVRFHSGALGRDDSYLIYLPHGYATAAAAGRRFPVFYLLHGDGRKKLHTALHSFRGSDIAPQLDRLERKHSVSPMIVVVPEGANNTIGNDTEWANTAGGKFETAVLDVVNAVDSRWSTIPQRSGRAIAGVSMGGYGAVNVALHHVDVFSVIESWSGYFTQTKTAVFAHATPAELAANSPALYVQRKRNALGTLPLHVFLYSGVGDKVTRQQAPFARQLQALGAQVKTATYRGPHDYRLWKLHVVPQLRFAADWLQSG